VDALLGAVDGGTIAASDVTLARALGLLGLEPSAAPIGRAEVERLVEARLLVAEARRLGLTVSPVELEQGWQATADRVGGTAALDRWLAGVGVERAWVRRLVEEELLRRQLVDLRFRSFVFVSESEVEAALGPPPHDADARERARQRLTAQAAERALAAWLSAARERARLRILLADDASVPPPFSMPPLTPPRP
jgi:hypothetical protein